MEVGCVSSLTIDVDRGNNWHLTRVQVSVITPVISGASYYPPSPSKRTFSMCILNFTKVSDLSKNPKYGLNELFGWIKWVSQFTWPFWVIMWRKILKTFEYDHNVKLRCFGRNEVFMKWIKEWIKD